MHTLWLASWYPNKLDPFNGDFVRRHAISLATQEPLTVIHVAKGERGLVTGPDTITHEGHLTERIHYFLAPGSPWKAWNRTLSAWRTFWAYRKAFRGHVKARGKPDLIHVHICMNAGLFALWLKWFRGIPYVVTEHYSIYVPGAPDSFDTRPPLYRYVNRQVLKRATGVHSVSRFLLTSIQRITPLRYTEVIPNAVDVNMFHRVKRPDPGQGPLRFIHISNFVPLKNVRGILDAFVRLQERRGNWELYLVGPSGEEIRAYGDPLKDRLTWIGEVPYERVGELLRESDVLVHFSRVENQPCVISEALCCGVPVLSSGVGGIPEVIRAENGVLVPEGDVAALAGALEKMLDTYKGFDGDKIAEEAAGEHRYEVIGKALTGFYRKAIQA